ncbi:TonB-dependent receptor plug domain-containing protein [uncultured Cytophaga sp.]|uniref:TonB-dependent receptor plug domain-containing protein n=1 Tax=uncultured Cytophaga sp. TaxID=160238 RepID=UPI002619CD73|nr:TonB-dependent receptor plug domain-containing protein [uncultured Cytophaga sp.]
MKKRLLKWMGVFGLIASVSTALAQSGSEFLSDSLVDLQEITIYGQAKDSTNAIGSKRMEVFNRTDVSHALNILPGVTLSNFGARNESTLFIRGFDSRQVPVFIDGVPVYISYDGYVDLARFTTFDLAEINVSKGFASMLYGPNTIGGAINLISRKPSKKFEFSGATGYLTGGYRTNLNVGSKLGKFYFQAGFSQLNKNYYNLSHDFDSTAHENGGRRDNSYSKDTKYSFRIGFTPTKKQEYVFNYVNQQGEKGTPVYSGTDTKNSLYAKPRYWQWPYWNKESFYVLSNTTIDSNNYIKMRVYYDIFKNELNSYNDDSYSKITKPYAFQSIYNDDSYGASFEYGTKNIKKNTLKFATHYKHDRHREYNVGEPQRTMEDNTISVGLEDVYKPFIRLQIIPGVSYNIRNSAGAEGYNSTTKEIFNYASNNNNAWNVQLGTVYSFTSTRILRATASSKTRFATMKDRYSYKLGTAIPNPDLNAERSMNLDLTYSDVFFYKLKIDGSVFYSKLTNTIQTVNNVEPGKSQMQNTGIAEFSGVEASAEYAIHRTLQYGCNYTFIERKNSSNSELKFTDVPNHKVFSYLQYSPMKGSYLVGSVEYNSKRYSTSYGTSTAGFMLLNAKGSVKVLKYFAVEGGVNNILDKNYSLSEGYPEQGRNYFVTLAYRSF